MKFLIVTGGRDNKDELFIETKLSQIYKHYKFSVLIHGNANGVDKICGKWAIKNELNEFRFPAKWSSIGSSAGPLRNRKMMEFCVKYFGLENIKLAGFDGGTGTADMIKICTEAGIDILDCKKNEN